MGKSAIQIEVIRIQALKGITVNLKIDTKREGYLFYELTDSNGHRSFVWYSLYDEDGCMSKKSTDNLEKNLFKSYAFEHGIELEIQSEKESRKVAEKNKSI